MSKTKAIGLGALIVGVIALGVSVYAVYIDSVHYQETIKPHTQHDEIYDRLARLDDKIERTEQSIIAVQDLGQDIWDINDAQKNLRKVKDLRDQAELAWDAGEYTDADKLISEAHSVLDQITLVVPAKEINWWLMAGTIAGVVLLFILIILLTTRAKEKAKKGPEKEPREKVTRRREGHHE